MVIIPILEILQKKKNIDEHGILQEDVLLSSPSYATSFVMGGSANGLAEWENLAGKTLKQLEETSN